MSKMNRLEKLKNELSEKHRKDYERASIFCCGYEDSYKLGFDAASAEYEKIIVELEGDLEEIKSYGHSALCELMKQTRPHYKCQVEEADNALQKLKEFRGVE